MSNEFVYSGLQTVILFELNEYGRPKATNLTAYTGLVVRGPQAFALNIPEPRRVPHTGNDRLLVTQIFPSKEPISGELQVGAEAHDVLAAISGVTAVTLAGGKMMPLATDKQGKEPNIALLLMQAAMYLDGTQAIHSYFVPSTRAVFRAPGAGENPDPYRYAIAPNAVSNYLWGALVSDDASGAEESAVQSLVTDGELRIASFIADGAEDTFPFPADAPASAAANIEVFTATGATVTHVTSGVTKDTDGVVFDYAPALNHEVHILYQKAS